MNIEFVINETHPDKEPRFAIRGTKPNDPVTYWYNHSLRAWEEQKPGEVFPTNCASRNCVQTYETYELLVWQYQADFQPTTKEELRTTHLLEKKPDPFDMARHDPYFFNDASHAGDLYIDLNNNIRIQNAGTGITDNPFLSPKI